MKTITSSSFLPIFLLLLSLSSCNLATNRFSEETAPALASAEDSETLNNSAKTSVSSDTQPVNSSITTETMAELQITVDGQMFSATLYDNHSTQALMEQLPLTVTMDELNGNEKFFYLSDPLPTAPNSSGNIKAGDFMLYGTDCLVLFYENFSTSYRYTKLGAINDTAGLLDALGNERVSVTFSQP